MLPPLTSYDQKLDEISKLTVNNLISQIQGTQDKAERIFVRGCVSARKSVKDLNKKI